MTFQWPYLLLSLVLIPILVGIYLLAQRRRRRDTVRFTNLALLSAVVGRGPGVRRHIPPALFVLGMAALLVALARPTAVRAVPRDDNTVMIVMDVSGSMMADDLRPDRMEAAKQAARAFVEALPDHTRVGLVSFSSRANLAAPASSDHKPVLRAINALAAGGGTAIGDGLDLALDQFKTSATDKACPSAALTLGCRAGFTSIREVGGLGCELAQVVGEGILMGPTIYAAGAMLSYEQTSEAQEAPSPCAQ